MKFWIDAQLPPQLASWLATAFHVEASNLDAIGLRQADDLEIFQHLDDPADVIVTKDEDFLDLVTRLGPPPKVLWVTCGNTSNRALRALLQRGFEEAVGLLAGGEPIVRLDRRE